MFINSETHSFALFYRFYFWACYSPSKRFGSLDYRLLYAESGQTVTRAKYWSDRCIRRGLALALCRTHKKTHPRLRYQVIMYDPGHENIEKQTRQSSTDTKELNVIPNYLRPDVTSKEAAHVGFPRVRVREDMEVEAVPALNSILRHPYMSYEAGEYLLRVTGEAVVPDGIVPFKPEEDLERLDQLCPAWEGTCEPIEEKKETDCSFDNPNSSKCGTERPLKTEYRGKGDACVTIWVPEILNTQRTNPALGPPSGTPHTAYLLTAHDTQLEACGGWIPLILHLTRAWDSRYMLKEATGEYNGLFRRGVRIAVAGDVVHSHPISETQGLKTSTADTFGLCVTGDDTGIENLKEGTAVPRQTRGEDKEEEDPPIKENGSPTSDESKSSLRRRKFEEIVGSKNTVLAMLDKPDLCTDRGWWECCRDTAVRPDVPFRGCDRLQLEVRLEDWLRLTGWRNAKARNKKLEPYCDMH
ncbi:uncharacterized protein PG998_013182 [Apiospora kogelbergensis]|uniref:uncharacterized protein n=1 Tax=Apiospora kogelbergensis TaxID=1337665 RepID=UPI00312F9463